VTQSVLNIHGEQIGDTELDPAIFGVAINVPVLHQALKMQLANARQGNASTKTRGDVAGGAVKPWRQKGTGRARQGTTRSPLWIKGGVTFGPHPRKYTQSMPKKMRRLALKSALASKLQENSVIIVDDLSMIEPRTKTMIATLQSVGAGPSTLILLAERNANVELSARNLSGVKVLQATNLNVADLLTHDYLVFTKSALELISVTYGDGIDTEATDTEATDTAADKGESDASV
jgi:large subunit ribosomal protein L4